MRELPWVSSQECVAGCCQRAQELWVPGGQHREHVAFCQVRHDLLNYAIMYGPCFVSLLTHVINIWVQSEKNIKLLFILTQLPQEAEPEANASVLPFHQEVQTQESRNSDKRERVRSAKMLPIGSWLPGSGRIV